MQKEELRRVIANLKTMMKENHIAAIVADFSDHTDYRSIAQGWGFSCGDGISSELRLEFEDGSDLVLASEEDSPASFSINNQELSL